MRSQSGNRINMTVRVLFFPGVYLSLFLDLEEDYGHIGYKGRGSIRGVSLSFKGKVARPQIIETSPAIQIRRTGLRTSVSNRIRHH